RTDGEGRRRGWGQVRERSRAGSGTAPPGEGIDRADQSQMAERLGEVPRHPLCAGVVLLGEQVQVVAAGPTGVEEGRRIVGARGGGGVGADTGCGPAQAPRPPSRASTARISPRWLNAWGKFPAIRCAPVSYSSANRSRSLPQARRVSRRAAASSVRPEAAYCS